MRFTKMHGLGNDYIVVEWMELAREIGRKNIAVKNTDENKEISCMEISKKADRRKIAEILECKFPEKYPEAEQVLRAWIQYACDRHFGIGADGVLIICPSQTVDFRMLIYNADGSRAKMCGNGIRCCAKYMWDSGRLNAYRYDNCASEKRLDASETNEKNLYDNCSVGEVIYRSGEKYAKKDQYNKLSGGIFRKRKYICTQSGYKVENNTKINNKNSENINKSGDCNDKRHKFLLQSGDDICKIEKNDNKYGEKYFQYLKIDTDSGIKTVKILKDVNLLARHFQRKNINKKIEKAVNGTKKVSQNTVKNVMKNRTKSIAQIITRPVATEILVNMGKPSTDYEHINIDYEGCSYTIIPVSMGNLHAVVFLNAGEALWDNQKTDTYTRLAAYIQNLDYFSDGVNVEFAQILDSSHIQMRVWERGVGETLACGTGACAVCVAAVKIIMEKTAKSGSGINTNLTEKHRQYIHIKLRGGTLRVLWTPGEDVWMSGPAVTVFEGA